MNRLQFLPATPALLQEHYGKPLPWTVRGYVAVRDGQVVGVGGIARQEDGWLAFSEHTPELGKKDAARCFRFMEKFLDALRVPVAAECGNSRRLLERLGFRSMGEHSGRGGLLMVRMPNG